MTRHDDKPDETGERRIDRGLEVVPGGEAADPEDFIIDKTKKPSVFQLREVTIPPKVAAERAEQIADGPVDAAPARDTVRDLEPPAPSVGRDELEIPAATMPVARRRSRALWTVLAVALAASAVTLVVVASGGSAKHSVTNETSAAAQAPPAPAASSIAAPPVMSAAVPEPAPQPKSKPPAGKPASSPEKSPSPAAPPSAFTTKPPF